MHRCTARSQHWRCRAIEAVGEFQGPEVQFLQGALARARVAASPPPVDVQLTQCQQFIDRATKRIEDLDRVRETESVRLKEAQGRLHRLQQEVAARVSVVPEFAIPGTNDSGVEVAVLKSKLAKTEAERCFASASAVLLSGRRDP